MLETPRHGDWRPEVLDQTLVAVDCRSNDGHDVGQTFKETSEEVTAKITQVCNILVRRVGVN